MGFKYWRCYTPNRSWESCNWRHEKTRASNFIKKLNLGIRPKQGLKESRGYWINLGWGNAWHTTRLNFFQIGRKVLISAFSMAFCQIGSMFVIARTPEHKMDYIEPHRFFCQGEYHHDSTVELFNCMETLGKSILILLLGR